MAERYADTFTFHSNVIVEHLNPNPCALIYCYAEPLSSRHVFRVHKNICEVALLWVDKAWAGCRRCWMGVNYFVMDLILCK